MGGLHLHLRRLATAAACLAALSGCGSDETEVPESLRGEPTCMWIAGARVHFEDGASELIVSPESGTSPAACTCLTWEEFESRDWEDELHAKALDICEDLADTYDQAWNDCQEYFESGVWFLYVFWNSDEISPPPEYDPGCIGG